jgi:type IV secretory pathway VirB10-like protein
MSDKIKFLDKEYSEADLKNMTIEDLLSLRNTVASNLGVASISTFKDHDTAVAQTMKALTKYEQTVNDEAEGGDAGETKGKGKAKEPKEPKERKLAKPAEAGFVKRPTRKMFSKVEIIKQHTGEEGRQHRWPNYSDGMLIIDAIETEGCIPWDIYNWESKGLMKVTEPTDEEYAERRAAWYAKHGRTDPEVEKEAKAKEREEAKAKREAEKAEKAKAKAEADAKKKAEADAKSEG